MAALERVVDALEERDCRPRGAGLRYVALCPSHDDRHPSLSIGYSERRQTVLIKCHTGCSTEAVLDALALEWKDLFDSEPRRRLSRA